MKHSRRPCAFTLVELLVVIGIITMLIAILLPVISSVRSMAVNITCRSNLREIGNAMRMYANVNRDVFPDAYTTGGSVYRMAPGQKNLDDPTSLTEVYGMPAVLHGIDWSDDLSKGFPPVRYLPANSKVWVCQAMPEWMRAYGNTYFWNQAGTMNYKSGKRGKAAQETVVVVQDNVSFLPYAPGFRRTTGAQPVISPASNYVYPHPFRTQRFKPSDSVKRAGAVNVLFMNGQVGTTVYSWVGGSLTSETFQ
jgi:prepilin-type N-terminal cleavage/methylation domain-containing protein